MDYIYVYLDKENYVKEFVGYEVEGFTKTELTYLDLPKNFGMGYYKYIDGEITLDEKKKEELYGKTDITADDFHDAIKRIDTDLMKSEEESVNQKRMLDQVNRELKEENEGLERQLANEIMESLRKEKQIESLKEENEITQMTLANETINSLALESRLVNIEKIVGKEDK